MPYAHGDFVLPSEYQSSENIYGQSGVLKEPPKWEVRYWNVVFRSKQQSDIPMPCMYHARPFWRGGLNVSTKQEIRFDPTKHVIIGGMDCKTRLVWWDDVKPPTDKEYDKYFSKLVEGGLYRVTCAGVLFRK